MWKHPRNFPIAAPHNNVRGEPKKSALNSCSYLHQILMDFFPKKIFHCYTQQKVCNKGIITQLTTLKKCRYTTL